MLHYYLGQSTRNSWLRCSPPTNLCVFCHSHRYLHCNPHYAAHKLHCLLPLTYSGISFHNPEQGVGKHVFYTMYGGVQWCTASRASTGAQIKWREELVIRGQNYTGLRSRYSKYKIWRYPVTKIFINLKIWVAPPPPDSPDRTLPEDKGKRQA